MGKIGNKRDTILKTKFDYKISGNFTMTMPTKQSLRTIWRNTMSYKITEPEGVLFIEQCDNTLIINNESMNNGSKVMASLFEL